MRASGGRKCPSGFQGRARGGALGAKPLPEAERYSQLGELISWHIIRQICSIELGSFFILKVYINFSLIERSES